MKMKAILKRTTGLLVVIAMLISMMPTVFADPTLKFKDFPTGWSKAAVEAAVANGLLNGFEDGTIRPEDNLTRAEMTAIITRAFGAKVKADISAYTDVAPNAWYYDSIAKAVQMGAVNGVSATEMNPDAPITREEVFTILARVLVLSSDNAQVLDKFHDAGKVSSWAKPYVIALTERGYVNGDDLGNANPQANISREEFAQLMHNAIRTYITKSGTYNKDMAGIVVVRVGDVELKNLTVSGDLVLGDGVGTDAFHTTNITVNGRLLARGGTNTLKRTTVSDGVVVNNMNGVTAFMNYRSEVVFAGIIENTKATFLNPPGGGGGYTPSPTTYSVTFKLTDGTPVGNPIRIALGQPIGAENMPADPTPGVGYDSFLGWFDGTTEITAATVVNGPINAVAKFNPITYTIEYLNPDGSAFSYFDPNFSKKTSFTVEDEAFALPVDANMARKGYTFHDKWLDEKNNEVTTISKAYIQEDTPRVIKLKGDFTINTYTLEYIPKDATLKDGVENPVQYTIENYQTVVFPEEKDLNVPDDKLFIGWYDGEGTGAKKISALNENDHITKTPDIPIKLYAHFKNVYTITFEVKDEAGAVISSETRRVVEGQSLSNDVLDDAMPAALSEKGYRFGDWMYDGAVFDADTVVTDTMGNITVTATRSMNSYRIVYQGEGTAFNFKDGYDAPRSYNVTNYTTIVLPTEENVKLPDNKTFMGWLDGTTAITALTDAHLTEDPDIPLTLSLNDETLFKVTFYKGYNHKNQQGDPIYVPALNLGLGDDIPMIADTIRRTGYSKGPANSSANIEITDLYPEKEIHTIRPTYWYEVTKEVDDGNGGTKMVTSLESFNEKTPIIADTDVYILYQSMNMHIKLGDAANEELTISASYKSAGTTDDAYMPGEKDTRILDAAKGFGVSARNQLKHALDNHLLPSQFDDAQDKVFGKLEELDILDANKMIRVLDIPVAISTLVKREKADDMIKQFIRDSITDPNKLDSLLDSMDIQAFIDQIGTDDLLGMLSNQQIVNALTDTNNKETIVSFIMNDLKSDNPTLLTPLKNYILGNPTALGELAVQLKAKLAADSAEGKSLRRVVLTSSELENVLKQPNVKTSVIDKITGADADDAILDILLNNEQVRHDLLEQAVKEDDFVSALAKAQQFKDYAGSMLRQDLDVKTAVLSALDTDLLSELRGNASFKAQFTAGAVLRTELENTIKLDTYCEVDDLIDYLFGKGSNKTYTFINGEDVFRNLYDAEEGTGAYDALTDDAKTTWKNEAYDKLALDLTLKQDFIDELEIQFTGYFANILNALATGSAISDTDMMNLIDTEIKNYISSYINKQLSVSPNVKSAIEDALVSYICDLLHQDDASITDANLRSIKQLILEKAYKNDQITAFIREFVKTDPYAETLIDHAYDVLDHDFVEIVHNMAEDSPEYATVEGLLKSISANIDAASLTDIIASNGENAAVIDLVKTYVKDSNYATKIQGYVEGFLETDVDVDFVEEYRNDIIKALKNVDISSMIDEDMIKKHINELPTKDEKIAFADKIYNALANSSDYATFMNSLFKEKTFTINKSNLPLIQAISNAIGNLDYDTIMAETNNAMLNKVIDTLGEVILKDYFNEMRDGYVGGLNAAIEQVKNGGEGAIASYTTSLTLTVNLIKDILKPLYEKAQEEVDEKLRKLPIRYDQNPYAQYLVTHDMLSKVFSGDGVETAEHSGYGIKGILDYYDYLLELFVVADDTFCWYGDDNNVTQEEFDSIYDALFGKVQRVHSKVNGILEAYDESGELPDRIKGIFDRVQQINSLITRFEPQVQAMLDKYFKSSINQGIEDGSIAENEKVLTFVDLMLGQEDPVFTIDSLYDLFYRFEPDMQDKLQELIASGKLRKAIDKFEETSIGSLFKGKGTIGNIAEKIDAIKNGEKVTESLNSVYELLEIVAATGIDAFRVDTSKVTERDVYQFSIGGITVTMTRKYD